MTVFRTRHFSLIAKIFLSGIEMIIVCGVSAEIISRVAIGGAKEAIILVDKRLFGGGQLGVVVGCIMTKS
jgi:hypothetical protein